MIPLVGGTAVLPQVESTGLRQNNISVTLNQLKSITSSPTINASFSPGIRFVPSRTQTRRSSLSSLYNLMKFEEEELARLNSRGSSAGICNGQGLRNCLETKQLTTADCNRNTENSPSSSTDSRDVEDTENSTQNMTINNSNEADNSKGTKTTKSKLFSKSCKTRLNKKNQKTKKSAKNKGNVKKLKVPSVFERLANTTKNKEDDSNSPKKQTSTIFYNKSCGNLLEIKRLQATYMPVLKPKKPKTFLCLPKVSMSKTSNKMKAQTPREPSRQSVQTTQSSHLINVSPRKSLETISNENTNKSEYTGTRKIYLSEVQSQVVDGIPGAPPVTPFPDDLTPVEYIPCLMDIKSQRAVKAKLEKIATRLKSEDQQRKENAIKENQKRQKELIIKLKHQQRAEIYALNKVMTELENQNFQKFMMKKEAISSMGV